MTATNVTTRSFQGQSAAAATDAAPMPTRADNAEQTGRAGSPLFVDVFAQTLPTPVTLPSLAGFAGMDKSADTGVDGLAAEAGDEGRSTEDVEAAMLATWLSSPSHRPSLSSHVEPDEAEGAVGAPSTELGGAATALSLLTPMQAGGASALPLGPASSGEQAIRHPGPSMVSPLLVAMGPAPAGDSARGAPGALAALPVPVPAQAAPVSTAETAEADQGLGDAAIATTTSADGSRLIQAAASVHGSEPVATLALHPRQPDLWQRPLVQALGERLQIQGSQGEEQAVIRLDPPSLGRVEIVLRQEGAGWQVQLSATHPEVARQLHVISDTLRQELSGRQPATVSVQVASDPEADGSGRQQRHAQDGREQPTPGRAWNADGSGENEQAFDFA